MSLRTRLILAFFVLAVVPLTAIVLYSYSTSLAAYRGAVEEASRLRAEQLNWRMEMARNRLDGTLRETATEVAALADGEPLVDRSILERKVREGFAPIAPMVGSFEFVPLEGGAAAEAGTARIPAPSDVAC